MTTGEFIETLKKLDPTGDKQITFSHEADDPYYSFSSVTVNYRDMCLLFPYASQEELVVDVTI